MPLTFPATLAPTILAGGSGTRLWPVSRAAFPKHLVELFGEESLLQTTVRRALEAVTPVHGAQSMGEAVERAYELAKPDGVVLLAPACASFDWFRDYAERGRAFKAEVERLRERYEREGEER